MYILLETIKETPKSLFFEAQHKENDTYHIIEIEKSEIENALENCGFAPVPKHLQNRMREFDCILDICQDIVKYSKEWYLLDDNNTPAWNTSKMYHNASRFNVSQIEILHKEFYPKRGELLVDGVIVKGFSARVK